jgi:hypothetical protein
MLRVTRVLLPLGFALLAGCASRAPGESHESDPSSSESIGTTADALTTVTRSDAISRGELWVDAKLQYCQSPNGAHDDDTSCSATCTRESNADWDPYRSDCSGFISWAWELPAPGRVTSEFAPFDTSVSTTINCTDMKMGDAANLTAGGHIVLFKEWTTPGKEAVFLEEPGCSAAEPYAHEFTSAVTCSGVNVDIAYEGESFTAIRYVNIADDPESTDAGATEPDASAPSTPTGQEPRSASAASNGDADSGSGENLQDANGAGNTGGCAIGKSSRSGSRGEAFFAIGLALLVLASRRRIRVNSEA